MEPKPYDHEMRVAVELAREAGAAILDLYEGPLDIEHKSASDDQEPVTQADIWHWRLKPLRLLLRLSVFRDGWTLEAAESVCEEPLAMDYLTQLHEHSLIQTEEQGEEMRFRLLETLRAIAGIWPERPSPARVR